MLSFSHAGNGVVGVAVSALGNRPGPRPSLGPAARAGPPPFGLRIKLDDGPCPSGATRASLNFGEAALALLSPAAGDWVEIDVDDELPCASLPDVSPHGGLLRRLDAADS